MEEREDEEPPLPPGWEARQVRHALLGSCDFWSRPLQDGNGRTFYVDHANRHTQWERPVVGRVPDISAQRRLERDRRFQQTMRRRIPTSEVRPHPFLIIIIKNNVFVIERVLYSSIFWKIYYTHTHTYS